MSIQNNYFFNAFFWSTIQKILTAIVGFISVPLLLDFYGKDQYGILSLAVACNAYASLLDLGMNTGAVRYFSLWKTDGKMDVVHRVARTNLSFYGIVALINASSLVLLAYFGESLFSTTHEQYIQLQKCLFIIAGLCFFSWGTTTYNQLLIANKQMAFTAQMACLMAIGKIVLVGCTLYFRISLVWYFLYLTALTASLYIPYSYKCKKDGMIDSLFPANYWSEFSVVLKFSLSIFALGIFQMLAVRSRPLILGLFSTQGPSINAEFKILEVIPSMILMLGGTFSGIFLPLTTEMVANNDQMAMKSFSYKWTVRTSIIMNVLCMPFIICASDVLGAYVGSNYSYLSIWLIVWCFTALVQMHTTPANALVLSYGRTKPLIIFTSCACVISMVINASLTRYLGVGSAILAYALYVIFIISLYYIYFYKKLLDLSRLKMFMAFFKPTLIALIIAVIIYKLPLNFEVLPIKNSRLRYLCICMFKTLMWLVPYIALIQSLKIEDLRTILKKHD